MRPLSKIIKWRRPRQPALDCEQALYSRMGQRERQPFPSRCFQPWSNPSSRGQALPAAVRSFQPRSDPSSRGQALPATARSFQPRQILQAAVRPFQPRSDPSGRGQILPATVRSFQPEPVHRLAGIGNLIRLLIVFMRGLLKEMSGLDPFSLKTRP